MDEFDADAVAERIRSFLAEQLTATGAEGYVLGVSGGLDSAVAARLAVDAVGADQVTGMVLPSAPNDPENMADAREYAADLGIEYHDVDIHEWVADVATDLPGDFSPGAVGNVRARVRMVALYAVANREGLLVVGPDNRSEHLLGYFTKYGDGAADVAPLADWYKTEVYDLARELEIPEKFVEKKPTAELWAGQTDEAEIGVAYDTIDPVLHSFVDEDRTVAETAARTDTDAETVRHLRKMVENSEHKRERPPSPGRERE